MKIALLGYGIEGASAYRYFRRLYPEAQFEIYDNAKQPKYDIPAGVRLKSDVRDFYDVDADLVIKTPAIAPSRVSSRGTISSVTQEFFDACPVPIIGVTGTKGKGTTASLIANMLKKAGIKTWLVGNIGLAALDVVEEINHAHAAGQQCVVVYELSSFQLWNLTKSPHIAVVLMIEPEHLDVHKDEADYIQAKSNVIKHQVAGDVVIYYADNKTSTAIAQQSAGKKLPYTVKSDDSLRVADKEVARRSDIKLYGEHNVGNVQAAILAAWQFTQNVEAIRAAIREFTGLPHRLEPVATVAGVLFINDSFSAAPTATLAAVKSFAQPTILIMGGYDRGLDFLETTRSIAGRGNIKKVLLFGQTKEKIAESFEACGWRDYEVLTGGLDSVVDRAAQLMSAGDVVLFSPGCASFDMFANFTERGNMFKELVAKV
jgi:UDP-N-acetylmuramoylalanine--D-glutamate ligase